MSGADDPRTFTGVRTCLTLSLLLLLSVQVVSQIAPSKSPAATPEASPTSTPTPPAQQIPSLTEVAVGASELERLVKEVQRRVSDDSKRAALQGSLEALANELVTRSQHTQEILQSVPSFRELQDLDSEWSALSSRLDEMEAGLLSYASELNRDIAWLKSQQDKWTTILPQLDSDASLQELQTALRQSLENLENTRTMAQQRLKATVTLQARAAERRQTITRVMERLDFEKAHAQRSLFQADTSPLWRISERRETDLGLQSILRKNYGRDWTRLREYARTHRRALLRAVLFFVLALAGGIKMRRYLPKWLERGVVEARYAHVFQRPFSVAVLAGLLTTLPLLPSAPAAARGLLSLLLMFPVLRILGPLFQPVHRHFLYLLVSSLLVIQAIKMTTVAVSWKRNLLALVTLAICCVAAWLSRQLPADKQHGRLRRRLTSYIVHLAIAFTFAAFLANLFGYFALSQALIEGALFGAYYALVLFVATQIITAVLSTVLKTDSATTLAVVRQYRGTIIKWSTATLTLIGVTVWTFAVLSLFTLRDAAVGFVSSILTAPLGSGETSFSASDVLKFILVFVLGVIFATAMRVVLREDVLKRLPVRHGVPFAISTISYYLMLLFVFLFALVAAGVQLSKFTLFTGAFGIGIGFGLQNTINNFASGIVLLFERPIRENDILEVEGAFGEVTRIGMRSTSIRTAEEAEVIVPNSTLVTGKVVNWSRLGRRRPVEIPVRAAYGTDPQFVIDLLVKTATQHADVLSDPPPAAFLQRFGDKALEFVLVFWVGRYYLYRKVLSEVAIKVNEAFTEADIHVRVPAAEDTQQVTTSIGASNSQK